MMTPLAFPFTKHGFHHVLLDRSGDVCLIARYNLRARPKPPVHWEVVVVQQRPARTFPNGQTAPAREAYPSTEQWGTAGWTYTTLSAARERFTSLIQNARVSKTVSRAAPQVARTIDSPLHAA
jgi:hypothetical protein